MKGTSDVITRTSNVIVSVAEVRRFAGSRYSRSNPRKLGAGRRGRRCAIYSSAPDFDDNENSAHNSDFHSKKSSLLLNTYSGNQFFFCKLITYRKRHMPHYKLLTRPLQFWHHYLLYSTRVSTVCISSKFFGIYEC
ncbi:hypothetical protein Y032_0028g1759 [Ancylostoma ceylanicum]|uniref:Uncharacterized protein n=1 Tax=Ancylostoma ceylanicum TaxID=53326 RepID=A0A016US46_9BILA|nr:hypothetical protein Y032_0028g1759 [Ancylostoma ceylanicum]